jgi:L-2-hydroxyglutarate oxidase
MHFTVTVDGRAKIGPTPIPAFLREDCAGLRGFDLRDVAEIACRQLGMLVSASLEFRRLAVEEFTKHDRRHLVTIAGRLAERAEVQDYRRWGCTGIGAQSLDTRTRKLEMDFVWEEDDRSTHMLNAVSPGWKCAIPFAEHVVGETERIQA